MMIQFFKVTLLYTLYIKNSAFRCYVTKSDGSGLPSRRSWILKKKGGPPKKSTESNSATVFPLVSTSRNVASLQNELLNKEIVYKRLFFSNCINSLVIMC